MASNLRQAILIELCGGPLDVSTLTDRVGVTIPEVSLNLKKLHVEGLVQAEKVSRRRIYRVGPNVRTIRHNGRTTLQIFAADGSQLLITLPRPSRGKGALRGTKSAGSSRKAVRNVNAKNGSTRRQR